MLKIKQTSNPAGQHSPEPYVSRRKTNWYTVLSTRRNQFPPPSCYHPSTHLPPPLLCLPFDPSPPLKQSTRPLQPPQISSISQPPTISSVLPSPISCRCAQSPQSPPISLTRPPPSLRPQPSPHHCSTTALSSPPQTLSSPLQSIYLPLVFLPLPFFFSIATQPPPDLHLLTPTSFFRRPSRRRPSTPAALHFFSNTRSTPPSLH